MYTNVCRHLRSYKLITSIAEAGTFREEILADGKGFFFQERKLELAM